MKHHLQSGKINITSLLIIAVLCYIGFVVVKFATASMTRSQIRTAIINDIGQVRGPELTEEACVNIVWNVLTSNGISETGDVTPAEDGKTPIKATTGNEAPYDGPQVEVTINRQNSTVHFRVTYQYILNLLLFKHKKMFEVEGDVQNYN